MNESTKRVTYGTHTTPGGVGIVDLGDVREEEGGVDTPRERVARRLFDVGAKHRGPEYGAVPWEHISGPHRESWLEFADAAIAECAPTPPPAASGLVGAVGAWVSALEQEEDAFRDWRIGNNQSTRARLKHAEDVLDRAVREVRVAYHASRAAQAARGGGEDGS